MRQHFPHHWTLATLAVLPVLAFIRPYWKSSSPPSLPSAPSLTSVQGMPPGLRNSVYEFVAINTSMQARRVVSGKKFVAAYQNIYPGCHTIHLLRMILSSYTNSSPSEYGGQASYPYNARIAAYENLEAGRYRVDFISTNWQPMPNTLVPIVDVASILPLATARHPFSNVSRQLYAEFQYFDKHAAAASTSLSSTTLTSSR